MHYFFLACLLACAPYHANNGMIGSRPVIFVLIFIAVVLMFTEIGEISALSQLNGGGREVNTDDTPPLSHDEIEFLKSLDYLERDDIESAYAVLERNFMDSARNPDPEKRINRLSQRKISLGGGTTFTSEYKLRADLEQARYLAETLYDKEQGEPQKAEFFASVVVPVYEKILSRIPTLEQLDETMGLYKFQRQDVENGIMGVYNRALHVPDVPATRADGSHIPIFGETLNPAQIQREWVESNGIVVVDDVLSKETLDLIQQKIMWESTVWYQTKLPQRFGGYAGAYIDDGLHQRILLQLSIELRKLLPDIFDGHPLKYMWAYKYDSDSNFGGINLHADEAAINVNLWLTPNEANIDPNSGGLVIYTVKPPQDWDFELYNRDTDFVYEHLLKPSGFANITVPYRVNRAVIFDSALFHNSDEFTFRKGYKNRRINLTLLYGDMKKQQQPLSQESIEL
jgi:hypothetical protein